MTVFIAYPLLRADIDDYWTPATALQADSYLELRGKADWVDSTDDDAKDQALQRAWDYMRTLPWIDDVFIYTQPVDVTNAHILLALEELIEPGVLTSALTRDNYLAEKNTAGVIVKKYTANAPAWKLFRGVDMLLTPYLSFGNQVIRA